MLAESRTPTHQELVSDLQGLREKGLTNLRRLRPEALHRAARLCGLTDSSEPEPAATETLLAAAVEAQGSGTLQSKLQMAAEYTFGLVPGTRDWPAQDRRKEAARVYGVSTERFRKAQEKTVYEQVAEEILKLCHRSRARTEADGQAYAAVAAPAFSIDRSAIPHLFTVDDVPDANIIAIVKDARELSIVGRTAINVIAGYTQRVLDMLRSGGQLRLVLVDPACDAARYLYGKNFAIYRRNLALAAAHLKGLNEDLRRDHPERSVELRLMSDIPPFSLLIAEKLNPDNSFLQVQLNFLYTRISRDRPILRVYRNDQWFDHFYAEFKSIWEEHSEPSTPERLLEYIEPTG